jgi:glycosyltransferase involved in cell wall biosynthesis
MVKISVIIPAHNEEKYIEKTLKSLVNQTTLKNDDYEIIVCNDASADKTSEIAKKYAGKVLDLKKCKSISEVRNKGAKIAKGEILLFIDADTIANKDLLEKLLEVKEPCGICKQVIYGDYDLTFLNNINEFLICYFPKLSVTPGCCMFISKKIFNIIGGFNEELKTNEDNEIFRRIISHNFKIGLINSQVYTSDRRIGKDFGKILDQFSNYLNFIFNKKSKDYEFLR